MTLGDATRDYIGALINIDMGVVSRWAEERNLGFSTFTDLSQKPEVAELIRERDRSASTASCPRHARVRRFANFPKELDPDEGELTRTRKLRREFLEQRYAALIDGALRRPQRGCASISRSPTRTAARATLSGRRAASTTWHGTPQAMRAATRRRREA